MEECKYTILAFTPCHATTGSTAKLGSPPQYVVMAALLNKLEVAGATKSH